ncbi:MAG: ABC transporter ATP-binding protein [Massiliimalia sp.]
MFKGLWFFVQFGWKSNKKYIIYNVCYQFINGLIPLVAVTMPKFIIDELMGQQRISRLVIYTVLLIGYCLVAQMLSNFFMLEAFTLRCRVAADFGLFMHKKLFEADFENLESPAFLDMKEKANKFLYGDWHGFSYVLDSALMIVGQFFTLAGIIAIVASMNLWIVLLFLLLVSISSIVDAWAKKNEIALSLEQVRTERGWMYFSSLSEDFMYGKEIRINSFGDWILQQESKYAQKACDFYSRRNRFYIKSGNISAITTAVQQILAYGYLITQVLSGVISIGNFTMYLGAVNSFSSAMKTVINSFVDINAYGIYYDAMRDYMNIPATLRNTGNESIASQAHTIEFRNVSFRYQGATVNALEHVNITIHPHEKLAVVGENGAGKSTFVKLLCRLYKPTEGEILLDRKNIQKYDYEEYMNLISAVFQDFKLFSFSLRDNVCLSKPADDQKIYHIFDQIGLSGLIQKLGDGLNTSVYKNFDETGFEPSGGEGQKIALARALYKNAPIVILDEPTAALDPRAEYEIYQQFNYLVQNKTAIYISHRLSSSKFCDKIAVFDHGTIIEYGTHDELYNSQGLYYELFHTQSQFYQ